MEVLYLLLTVGVGIAILANVIDIQWVHGDEWRERAKNREASLYTDPARRGNIYSSDGKLLATTVTLCDLYLDLGGAWSVGDSVFDSTVTMVCQLLDQAIPEHDYDYYLNRITSERSKTSPSRCYLIQRRVPYSTWHQISQLKGWRNTVVKSVDGNSVVRQEREHIYGNLAGNTIGFRNSRVARTYTGLEGYYDSILRGQDGVFNRRRLTKGIWLPDEPRERKEVPQRTDGDKIDTIVIQNKIDGKDIVSTIDTRYQDIADNALRKALRTYGGLAGCAILMEMETGYVLACANLALDTNVHDYREMHDRNVTISDVYEPGSTFKTIILTAMLNDPAVRIDTTMRLLTGYKNFGGKDGEIRDDHTLAGRDSLSVKEVIEQSSNVGMCELGWHFYNGRRDTLRHIVERMFPYGKMNPDVKAPEYRSYINDLRTSNRDFLNFCYGYSTRVSALQLIAFYNAIGAGGRMVKPLFCRAVIDGDRRFEVRPIVLNPCIASKESLKVMREMLEGVVENGTGNNIKNNTYGIAGKTGTAMHSYKDRRRYNGSFAGFFPSENPKYTCLVMIEDSPAYGRQAALVFKSIADCVVAVDKKLSNGGVKSVWPRLEHDSAMARQHPYVTRGNQKALMQAYKAFKLPYLSADSSSSWVYYSQATDSLSARYYGYAPAGGRTPNCQGMSAKDAVALLHEQGLRVKVNGFGHVVSQIPQAGQSIRKGSVVTLNLK